MHRILKLLRELKRRKVYQATLVYVVLAVAGLELVDVLVPMTRLPDWTGALLLALAIVGLPAVVVLSWTFDLGSEGVTRTPAPAEETASDGAPGPIRRWWRCSPSTTSPARTTPSRSPWACTTTCSPSSAGRRPSPSSPADRSAPPGPRRAARRDRPGAGSRHRGGGRGPEAGDRVRPNLQVTDAATGAHRWTERYDHPHHHPVSAGLAHAALGREEEAYAAFERVEHWGQLSNEYLRYFFPRELGPLGGSPRREAMLRRIDRSWGAGA